MVKAEGHACAGTGFDLRERAADGRILMTQVGPITLAAAIFHATTPQLNL